MTAEKPAHVILDRGDDFAQAVVAEEVGNRFAVLGGGWDRSLALDLVGEQKQSVPELEDLLERLLQKLENIRRERSDPAELGNSRIVEEGRSTSMLL